MTDLKLDPHNYRIHNDKNKRLIRKSLEDCGAGRSILFDKDDCIIAGNGVYEQAKELGLPVRIIESSGEELIAIKRTDLSTEDAKRKALALADNHTSDTSIFDMDVILENFTDDDLDAWEFSIDTTDLNLKGKNDPNGEFDEFGEFGYANKSNVAWKQLIVNFNTPEDYVEFARITGLNLTENTRSIFFPMQEKEKIEDVYE